MGGSCVADDTTSWRKQFAIQSEVDLDFVIGQKRGFPVGLTRDSPPEFRRRILAAATSYRLQLRSIDYALKRYVEPTLYENEGTLLGDAVSDFLRDKLEVLKLELQNLHTEHPTFGQFGAEITLFRIPHALDVCRLLANRGLLLEVLPTLRLCLEMMAWASVAFGMVDEAKIVDLKAQRCVSQLTVIYPSGGRLYGYLSAFSHWGHIIHRHFISLDDERVGVLHASVRYRAMALALSVVLVDVLVEVARSIYHERSEGLVLNVQGVPDHDKMRKAYLTVESIVDATGLDDLKEIFALMS
jgi:hypothetical protein